MEKSTGVSLKTNRTCLLKLPRYYADAATPNLPFGDWENVHTCGLVLVWHFWEKRRSFRFKRYTAY